ncbi:MAG TPA: sensor histidine kinase [Pilimelia sp.]|nr:sensor histidine kinase [Pilimelia sp.]
MTARLRLSERAQDIALAVFVALMQIQGTQQVASSEDIANLDPVGVWAHAVLLAASGLILAVRRRWPVTVFVVVAAASLVYYGADYPEGPGWAALFVAIYTVAAYGDEHRYVRVVVAGLTVLTVGWLLAADLFPLADAGWAFFRIGTAVMAASLGESVRMRRELAAAAQARAELAERTRDEEARRRVDAERLRIAREVHDTLAHAITVINVHAGVSAHVLDKRPQQAREALVTIQQTSARAMRELRATLGVLTDVDAGVDADDRRAPAPGLGQLAELAAMAREAGLDLRVEADPAPCELPGTVDSAAYRILQESITNVIRHAGPARVAVSLRFGPDDLRILVADDGVRGAVGTEGDAGDRPGRGIVGMRERCALLGGQLTAGPRPGGGFEVRASLPFRTATVSP